jgi:tetratricopeptide (TPR) repeat protein
MRESHMMGRCALVFLLLLAGEAARGDDARMKAALAACRQADVSDRKPNCYFLFGLADIESGKVDAARLHMEEAGRRLEAAGDPAGAWKAWWVLAEYERRFGRRPDLKLASFEKALAVVERAKAPDAPFRVDDLEELRDILKGSPRKPDSIKSVFLQLFEAVSRNGYATALLDGGELGKAERQLGMASELAKPFGAMLDRSIARNIGDLRRRQGRLDEARVSYQKALAAPKTRLPFTIDDRQEGDVAALYGLAEIEVLGGRTDQALGWNDRALTLARAAGEGRAELSLLNHRARSSSGEAALPPRNRFTRKRCRSRRRTET